MARTSAERQRDYRQRHGRRVAALEAETAGLRDRLARAEDALATAGAEIERLAGLACRHPSAAVSGGRCQACGADVW